MKTRWRFTGLFLASFVIALPAHAVIDRVIDKTFETKTGVAVIRGDTFSGGVTVTTSDDPHIRVLVRQTVEAVDEKAAEKLLASLEVKLDQSPDGTVALKISPRRAVRWTWQNWSPAALAIEISAPRSCQLELHTGEGDITVGGVKGKVGARTAAGAIFIGEVEGEVVATNTLGDISITACTGPLKLLAKNGNVLVGRSGARADLSAVDGVIEVQAARGPVVARGNRTDIKVNFVHPLTEPSDLNADGGDVTAGFDPRSAATLNARASKFGSVRVRDLEIVATKGKPGDSSLTGTLNGGGPLIKIRASGGQVRLTAVPSL
ncbi:MAG: hypothetical protein QM760_00390 [Nibricoccus sp.]